MIPLKLELTNFLSYRETAVLEFDGIHLACISGLNGAGKSSILDGITWALFGRSRSKSDDDLVNRMAVMDGKGAHVVLTFILESSTYRIIRHKATGKSMLLELQLETEAAQWKTLSESKLRETQETIDQLLRMNYDTFINASFLLQGKADEFTTKTPGKRKEILAELLEVNKWDRYKEAVTTRRKEVESGVGLIDAQLQEIERELEEEDERKTFLAQARVELTSIEERLADKEALVKQLRVAETAVKHQKQLVENLAGNLARSQSRLSNLQQNRAQRQQERNNYQSLLAETETITANYKSWEEVEALVKSWQAKADEYNRHLQSKRPHELTVTQARSRLEQRQQELEAQTGRVIGAEKEQEEITQTLITANESLKQLAVSLADLEQQEKEWHEARSNLQTLESERKLLAQELAQLQTQEKQIKALKEEKSAVDTNLQEAQKSLDELQVTISALDEQNQQYLSQKAELDSRQAEQPRLKDQMNRLKSRMGQLEGETGGDCPLCGQPLSDTHRQSVIAQLEAEGKESGDRFRANKERITILVEALPALEITLKRRPNLEKDQRTQQQRLANAEARLKEIEQSVTEWEQGEKPGRLIELAQKLEDESAVSAQQERIAELETAVKAKGDLESQKADLQKQISTAEARQSEIERLLKEWEESGRAALDETKRKLAEEDYAIDAQKALAEIDSQINSVGYDQAAHDDARLSRDELSQATARYQELKQAEAAVKPLEDTLTDLETQITEQQRTVADLDVQHQAAVAKLESDTAESGDLRAVEGELFRLREEQSAANQRLGTARQRLDVLEDLRVKRQNLNAQRVEKTQLIRQLTMLERACGRNGVQALLIEQALPEIEERANELLDRLSGGQMYVRFETQKQLKSRDALAETLEIQIGDNAGERPYANFSGGEQFRVNFAIRLALSQVLAKRAGARLQTLVIDEGFGSQDPSGRQRLVEAINTIQDDFARILIITHIDELRDAFPTRIEVEKSPSGSTISIN